MKNHPRPHALEGLFVFVTLRPPKTQGKAWGRSFLSRRTGEIFLRYSMFQNSNIITCPSCLSKIDNAFICHSCGFFKPGFDLSFVEVIFNHNSFPLKVCVHGSSFFDLNLTSSQIGKSYFHLLRLFPDNGSQNYFAVVDLEFLLLKKDFLILGHLLNADSLNADCSSLIRCLINNDKSFIYQLLSGNKEELFHNNVMTEYFPLVASLYLGDERLAKDWLNFNLNIRARFLANAADPFFANCNTECLLKMCSPVDVISSYYLIEEAPHALSVANSLKSSFVSVFTNRNFSIRADYHYYVLRLFSCWGLFFNHSDNIRSLIFSFPPKDCNSFFAYFSHLYPFSNRDIKFIPDFYRCFTFQDFSENIPLFVNTLCLFYPFKWDKLIKEYLLLLNDKDLLKINSPYTLGQIKDLILPDAPSVLTSSTDEEAIPPLPPAPEVQSFTASESISDTPRANDLNFNEEDNVPYHLPVYNAVPKNIVLRRRKLNISDHDCLILDKFIGFTDVVEDLKHTILKFAKSTDPVLLVGETGTGKEVVAEIFKELNELNDSQYRALSCGNINENILLSELFGHVKGAYTGAHKDKTGLLGDKNIRLIFIDELNSAPAGLQDSLLRFMQDGSYISVGDNITKKSSARVIFAVNQPVNELLASGRLRDDIFHRMSHVISVPPLRERREDIPFLLDLFSKERNLSFTNGAVDYLLRFPWNGNVRELKSMVSNLNAHIALHGNTIITESIVKANINSVTLGLQSFSSSLVSTDEYNAMIFLDEIANIINTHFKNQKNIRMKEIAFHFVSITGKKLSSYTTFSTDYLNKHRPHFANLLKVCERQRWNVIRVKCPQIFKVK
ncbi:MAG: sigma 54-interacting transcriptional regulator [Ignavibacteriaceae bacterium]|nr:sigma 54-interacting transcriptional regulator [Ignavibacteriaceae bacterium]